MGGVPSVPTDPNQRIQVISAGYSRTGTVSMSMALEKLLGKPSFHGGTQLLGREDAIPRLWTEIFDAKLRGDQHTVLKLLAEATKGFASITDAPGVMFLPELRELYPDAKVIIVERDPVTWFKSLEKLGESFAMPPWFLKTLLAPLPTWRWFPYWVKSMEIVETQRFGTEYGPERLPRYNAWAKEQVPESQRLTMSLKDGWEPLAKFLDVDVPDEPFPRANDSEAIVALAKKIFLTGVVTWVGIFTAIGVLSWLYLR